ncbi:MAG TPA: cupin domain-containing protein [Gaiellaceae bacterium]|nr:cupin domain-containing protein [Gaiellaceae bacterium]
MSWFVRNIRDLQWRERPSRGFVTELVDDDSAQVGANLFVLRPGESMSMYHWEADQEGFLVLSGEALLILEDEEHPLRQWDYFHCPASVPHTIVGTGSGPAAILALGARQHQEGQGWGGYPYSEVAMKHDASAEEETTSAKIAYARFPESRPAEYQEGWLP